MGVEPAGTEPGDECTREDCRRIANAASDVYCDITGGRLSYPTYDARTILAEANEETQRLIDEAVREAVAEVRAQVERDIRHGVMVPLPHYEAVQAERDGLDELIDRIGAALYEGGQDEASRCRNARALLAERLAGRSS